MKKLDYEKVAIHIISWLKDYAKNAKVNGYVMGVSGGIDSAVVSTLVARTGLDLLVLQMPIKQIEEQDSNSEFMINWLKSNYHNVLSKKIDLTNTFNTFEKDIDRWGNSEHNDLVEANSRSRLRMMTLYHFAQTCGYLVAGTGNKVEDFGIGFYTKYGDGGVDVSPIADLMKSEVYELAQYLGIPERISNKELNQPTDGLWSDGRTDEDQIGATYDELEWAMNFLADPKNLGKTVSGRDMEVINIYQRFHNANKHKMLEIPVCSVEELRG